MFLAAPQLVETVNQQPILLIVAGIGFAGTMSATVLSAVLTARAARKASDRAAHAALLAAEAATAAQAGIATAQAAAEIAQTSAKTAASKLVTASKVTDKRLETLQNTANDTQKVTEGTHLIVNSQRTKMLRQMATQARLIAKLLPKDDEAQLAATTAETDADQSEAAAKAIERTSTSHEAVRIMEQPAAKKATAQAAAKPPRKPPLRRRR